MGRTAAVLGSRRAILLLGLAGLAVLALGRRRPPMPVPAEPSSPPPPPEPESTPAPALRDRRAAAALTIVVSLVAWYSVYDLAPDVPTWANVVIVAAVLLPATFALAWLALPLREARGLFLVGVAFLVLAAVFHVAGWDVAANVAKLPGVMALALWFLSYFEQLWWVVLIALIIPLVDAVSVWRGPTRHIVTEQPEVFTALSYAVPVPGDLFALGLPDVLFFTLFLGAAARWGLRLALTWVLMLASFALTISLAVWVDPFGIGGLPALPGLSLAFVAANGDLLWRRRRSP